MSLNLEKQLRFVRLRPARVHPQTLTPSQYGAYHSNPVGLFE
jgi:hypothetical protein